MILRVKVIRDRNWHGNISKAKAEVIALWEITLRAVLRTAACQRAAQPSEIRQQHLPEGGLVLRQTGESILLPARRQVDTVCALRGGRPAAAA